MKTETITINSETCQKCALCAEVCPNKIIKFDEQNNFYFRDDRINLCFKCGQCMSICPSKSIIIQDLSYSNNFFELPKEIANESEFLNLLATRRAVRNFKDKPVPKELLEKIVQAIKLAPPSFPPIKTELVVVQNRELIKSALPYMIEFYDFVLSSMKNPIARFFIKQSAGKEKFNVIKNHLVPLMKSRLPELKLGTEDTLTRNASAMILFHANKNAENYQTDIYIAASYGMLALHSLGLGGSIMDIIPPPINKKDELKKMFLIPETNEVVTSLIIGYPKYKYQRGIKRELKSIKWL